MPKFLVLCLSLCVAAGASAVPVSRAIVGHATNDCVVAVPLDAAAYGVLPCPAQRGVRVIDSSGIGQPCLVRPRQIRRPVENLVWHSVTVSNLSLTGGVLSVECALPETVTNVFALRGLRVRTPLDNFEQVVTIADVSGAPIASHPIFDYSGYADVRSISFRFDGPVLRRFRLTFMKPRAVRPNDSFEQTVETDGGTRLVTRTVERRQVVDRPFRIDQIDVAEARQVFAFKNADPEPMALPVRRTSGTSKATTFEIFSSFAPVYWIDLNVFDANFSRTVDVVANRPGDMLSMKDNRIFAVHLPGSVSSSLRVSSGAALADFPVFTVKIHDGDNAPLTFGNPPLRFGVMPQDVVFIAQPGKTYRLVTGPADAPRATNDQIEDYIREVQDPVRWSLAPASAPELPAAPSAFAEFFRAHGLLIVSLAVFAVLIAVCLRLFKSVPAAVSGKDSE